MTKSRLCVIAAAVLASTVGLAAAEVVWVKTESADVRAGKGSIYDVLTVAKKGQPLEITQHDGHWLQVKISPTSNGWVFDSAISSTQVNGGNGPFNIQAGPIGGLATAAGSKGFDESTNNYAAGKHFNKAPLQHLIDLRKNIQPTEWEKFNQAIQAGHE